MQLKISLDIGVKSMVVLQGRNKKVRVIIYLQRAIYFMDGFSSFRYLNFKLCGQMCAHNVQMNKKKGSQFPTILIGATRSPAWTRTRDPMINSHVL
jgi:hypothetical protein